MSKKPEVTYTLTIEPEDMSPEGQFDSGDDQADKELIAEIYRRLEFDLWAWCYVKVIATCSFQGETFRGSAGLGGCSYFGGEKEFTQPGGYYEDLKSEAYQSMIESLESAQNRGEIAGAAIKAISSTK